MEGGEGVVENYKWHGMHISASGGWIILSVIRKCQRKSKCLQISVSCLEFSGKIIR